MKVLIGFLFLFSINQTFSQLFTHGLGVTDVDGNNYPTININGQEWMAENLRTSKYANGDPIPNVTDVNQWGNLTTGAWVHYNNDSQYENPYGKLYNWHTVADPRNVCPTGWHVPSDAEWNALIGYLDPSFDPNPNFSAQSTTAGGMMKSTGTQYWQSPNSGATNESGFTGLPSGNRSGGSSAIFSSIGGNGCWWSATENLTPNAWSRFLEYYESSVYRYNAYKRNGFSVRCLKNGTSSINLINPSPKKLVKILNMMGQETSVKTNEILFYIYTDGSIEKVLHLDITF